MFEDSNGNTVTRSNMHRERVQQCSFSIVFDMVMGRYCLFNCTLELKNWVMGPKML